MADDRAKGEQGGCGEERPFCFPNASVKFLLLFPGIGLPEGLCTGHPVPKALKRERRGGGGGGPRPAHRMPQKVSSSFALHSVVIPLTTSRAQRTQIQQSKEMLC